MSFSWDSFHFYIHIGLICTVEELNSKSACDFEATGESCGELELNIELSHRDEAFKEQQALVSDNLQGQVNAFIMFRVGVEQLNAKVAVRNFV